MSSLSIRVVSAWRALRGHFWAALLFDAVLIILVFVLFSSWQTRNLPDDSNTPALAAVWLEEQSAEYVLPPGDSGVVYFFAPWCSICKASISNLDELVEGGDITWARAVALDYSTVDEVRQFIHETEVSIPVVLGSPDTTRDWQIRGFPTYFVIDADGKIVSRSVGYSTKLGLRARTWWNKS